MKYRVRHYTEYTYDDPVSICYNRLCLTPMSMPAHECLTSDINIVPEPNALDFRTDFFGNQLAFFSIHQEHKRLRINSSSIVDVQDRENMARASSCSVLYEQVKRLEAYSPEERSEIVQYVLPSHYIPYSEVIKEFAAECFPQGTTLWKACDALMKKIHKNIVFKPGFTTINTPVESVIQLKKGVCQDFAHLMITCLRNMGVPARYVSGYIETIPPPGKEKLVGADASHAWVSVCFPGVGWIEFDPTNCQLPADKHIIVAYGRDYLDVAPIKGIVFSAGKQKLTVKVDVESMSE